MQIEYIKTKGGDIFYPQKAGIKDETKNFTNYPVCIIKKLFFGTFQIDYFDRFYCKNGYSFGDEDFPNTRIILYPNGIEEIRYGY